MTTVGFPGVAVMPTVMLRHSRERVLCGSVAVVVGTGPGLAAVGGTAVALLSESFSQSRPVLFALGRGSHAFSNGALCCSCSNGSAVASATVYITVMYMLRFNARSVFWEHLLYSTAGLYRPTSVI